MKRVNIKCEDCGMVINMGVGVGGKLSHDVWYPGAKCPKCGSEKFFPEVKIEAATEGTPDDDLVRKYAIEGTDESLKEALDTVQVFGIADCYGIQFYKRRGEEGEGFVSPQMKLSNPSVLLSEGSVQQRNTVTYSARVTEDVDEEIRSLLVQDQWKEALIYLKKNGFSVAFPQDKVKQYTRSWRLIPY